MRALNAGAVCFLHKPLVLAGSRRLADCVEKALKRRGEPSPAVNRPKIPAADLHRHRFEGPLRAPGFPSTGSSRARGRAAAISAFRDVTECYE